MGSRFPSEEAERVQIRMPDGMRDELKLAAESNGLSMNAEIIHRLKQVGPAGAATPPSHGSSLSAEITMNKSDDTSDPGRKTTGENWFAVATSYELAMHEIGLLVGMAVATLVSEAEATPADQGDTFVLPGLKFDEAMAVLRAANRLASTAGRGA